MQEVARLLIPLDGREPNATGEVLAFVEELLRRPAAVRMAEPGDMSRVDQPPSECCFEESNASAASRSG